MASSSRSKSDTTECTAHDEDTQEECTCTQFRKLKTTELCAECYHTRKHHIKPTGPATARVQQILANILHGSSGSSSSSSSGSSSSSSSSALQSINKARKQTTLSGFTSRSKAANQESNRGMRPILDKGKGKNNSNSANLFKVVSAVVLPYGTKFLHGELQLPEEHQRVPDKIKVQTFVLNGLAVLRGEKGIEFDRTCDHESLTDALRDLLPLPFGYFDRLTLESDDPNAPPPWVLAAVVGKRLKIVPAIFPTGSDVDYNKGASTTGFRNNRLWIVSRQPIPQEVMEDWVQPEALAFRNATGLATGSGDEANDSDSDASNSNSEPSGLRRSKRRSTTTNYASDEEPAKKKTKRLSTSSKEFDLPDIFNDTAAKEIMDDDYIDLTVDDSLQAPWSTSGGGSRSKTPPPKPNAVDPAFSNGFKNDPTLGDPYAKQTFDF
ncbi:hypothetical protein FB451DRAFT_1561369 [Mycena latifolia]|nr:hypothetical protein FB451DRAFT_1561369 [Mycena latifolia]